MRIFSVGVSRASHVNSGEHLPRMVRRVGLSLIVAILLCGATLCGAAAIGYYQLATSTMALSSELPDEILDLLNDLDQPHVPLKASAEEYAPMDASTCDMQAWPMIPASLEFPSWLRLHNDSAVRLLQPESLDPSLVSMTQRLLVLLMVTGCLGVIGLCAPGLDGRIRTPLVAGSTTISVLALTIWGLSIFLTSHVKDRQNLERFQVTTPYLAELYRLLWPLAWQVNPYPQIRTHIISEGVLQALSAQQPLFAGELAMLDYDDSTRFLRATAHYQAAQASFHSGELERARHHSDAWLAIIDPDLSMPLSQSVATALAYGFARDNRFEDALDALKKPDRLWDPDEQDYVWSAVLFEHLSSLPPAASEDTVPVYANLMKAYLLGAGSVANGSLPVTVRCTYVSQLQEFGRQRLAEGEDERATAILRVAEEHVPDDDATNAWLALAAHQKAIRHFEAGKNETAIELLQQAFARDPDGEGIACSYSFVVLKTAIDLAIVGDLATIRSMSSHFDATEDICHFEGEHEMTATLYIELGRQLLKLGQFDGATAAMREALKTDAPDSHERARFLLNDIESAKNRLYVLTVARRWVEGIPDVTGSLCQEASDVGQHCEYVDLYNGMSYVGVAHRDMKETLFETDERNIVLSDSTGNGVIDRVDYTDPVYRRVLVETDGDFRIDGELLYDANDGLIKSTTYSGQVLIRIPSGAIRKQTDAFSAPDAFLEYFKNETFLGRSATYENSNFPGWSGGFVVRMVKGDYIMVRMFDEDLFNEPQYIGGWLFNELPTTNTYFSENYDAVLEFIVTPTRLPEGLYNIKGMELVNVFEHGKFDDAAISDLVSEARAAHDNKTKLAKFASWVGPELVVFTLLAKERLAIQILTSFAGSMAMEAELVRPE